MTDFFFCPDFVKPFKGGDLRAAMGGGVDAAGESRFAFAIDLRASWNGSIEDGCAMLADSFLATGGGAFLKLGSFGLGFGAEKNEESDFASLTDVIAGFASFFKVAGLDVAEVATAGFFAGGATFDEGGSVGFRFLLFESGQLAVSIPFAVRTN